MSSDTESLDPADPVGYFLEDLTYHGKTDRTKRSYERVLRRFESFVTDRRGSGRSDADDTTGNGTTTNVTARATHRDCMAFVHSLRGDHAESTVASYAAYLHRYYTYMTQVGAFESNPMTLVMEEMDESIDKDPARREIDVPAMRAFLDRVRHPLHRAVIVTLLKTGMRVGELCNLDLRDVSMPGSPAASAYDLGTRPALESRPDSLYVTGDARVGEPLNGEIRSAANKRKRETVIPIDDEIERVLTAWLAIRPDAVSPAEPLFIGTAGSWGERLDPESVRHIVEEHARDHGWYRTGGGASENVTPHYFRHFFTTHLRDRTGDRGVVKYLRGDVAEDIIDTYTHNWGDQVRATYESHIYELL
ncbi:Site-specific recombinase XerD [Halopenitus malekzadehii]|uniref:Site-specific recombinase XerD n=1 Tax=Halopenitus malekzadehii TaxID=1267564 RepID=A0A1H6IAC0_9EURY|nr:tyrosine-type recombinase/integrase [Halopenitus malekzadehii]SEH43773.1 Site-specific recombinase XerD [Halopenitus malekzadehii]